MRLAVCTAAVCAVALVAVGCGDDNDTLSYDETGNEIGAICADISDLGDDLTGDLKNDAEVLERDTPRFEAAIEEVRELEVHEDLESIRDELVANGEQQLALVEEAQQHAAEGDRKAYIETMESGQALDKEGNRLAMDLGAEECIS